eukprot:CAMPEP_0117006476 /NCGR_PEP_ID=MMETSP0472-20121206/6692_1 /TAXON_ID=693140 ORGANISM="Tiarina fusus, Strain LIS" /NCGR_SAMPLE_ID=MMETSP0472 /ASSEMBLY_ACC=CAM_ASM_000603 /LENGTH=1162 /DNA_ID=CAMNT_0004707955 /DNA_START=30 /DNA_END=3516 /DNA_ORIENTATION=+
MESKTQTAATPPSTLAKTSILVKTPSGRTYKDSPTGDTYAETPSPSSISSNCLDEHANILVEESSGRLYKDSPSAETRTETSFPRSLSSCAHHDDYEQSNSLNKPVSSFGEEEGDVADANTDGRNDETNRDISRKAKAKLETPPRTPSTARMMLLAQQLLESNQPTPDEAYSPLFEGAFEGESNMVTPTKTNISLGHSVEKSFIQPNSLFAQSPEGDTPLGLAADEDEPGRIPLKQVDSEVIVDDASVRSDSSSDCPFDCVDDYKMESVRMEPSLASSNEIAVHEEEETEHDVRKKSTSFSRACSAIKSSFLWAQGKETPLKAIICDLAVDEKTANGPADSPRRDENSHKSCSDIEAGAGVKNLIIAPTKSMESSNSENDTFSENEAIERELFPDESSSEEKSAKQKPIRQKMHWGFIVFYFSIAACVVVIIVFASLLLVQKKSNKSIQAQSDASPGVGDNTAIPEGSESTESGDVLDDPGFFHPDSSNPGPSHPATNQPESNPPEPAVENEPIIFDFVLVGDNEACSNAAPMDAINVVYRGNTNETSWDDTVDVCGDSMAIGHSAWYTFASPVDILIEASTCGRTEFDTQITILSGDCGELRCEAFNDQSCGDQSRVTWFAQHDKVYHILVQGYREEKGVYDLTLSPAGGHGTCTDAKGPVNVGSTHFGTTAGSTQGNLPQCGTVDTTKPGVWYTVDESAIGWVRAAVLARDPNFSAQVAIFSGADCGTLQCEGGSTDGTINWRVEIGTQYYIFVSSSTDVTGGFDLYLVNDWDDTCNNAIEFFPSNIAFLASSIQARPHKVPSCGGVSMHTAPGIWFTVQGTGRILEASTCTEGTTLDTEVSVFQGSCDELECVAGSGQNLACGDDGTVSWHSELDRNYLVFVSGHASRTGDFWLKIDQLEMGRGSVCVSPQHVAPSSFTSGTTDGALEVASCGSIEGTKGIWHEFQGTGHSVSASVCSPDTNFDARISLFSGSCGDLECMGQTTATCSDDGTIEWIAAADTPYYLLVHGADSMSSGNFRLELEDAVLNDSCERAAELATSTHSYFGSNVNATLEDSVACERRESSSYGIWYTFVGSGNEVSISTCSELTEFSTEISIFSGSCGDFSCVDSSTNGCGDQAAISVDTEEGTVYFVRIRGENQNDVGNFVMGVSFANSQFGW